MNVGPVESFWLAVNLLSLALTIQALIDARRDQIAVKALNGRAREVAAAGDVRRAIERIVKVSLLLGVVLASEAFRNDREIELTPSLVLLMLVPCVILLSAYLDARERRLLIALVARETRKSGAPTTPPGSLAP
jgi:hypothetical protein